uniref:Adenosine deaminase n=1 Tax=Glossina brevipalpis TaxID=37001 RepID=A0A1A9WPY1_9MUSC
MNYLWFLFTCFLSEAHRTNGGRAAYSQPNVQALNPSEFRRTPEAYQTLRQAFLSYEESRVLGYDIILNANESLANEVIMKVKTQEYEKGLVTPHLFAPSRHLFSVLDEIKKSNLFALLTMMPKGAVLHAHDTALCSTDFLIELTYRDNLWLCHDTKNLEVFDMRFSRIQPKDDLKDDCEWEPMEKARHTYGAQTVDDILREQLTLYPTERFTDNNEAWQQFMKIFALLDGLLFYVPNWSDYYYHALEEFYADGVQYLEFRSTLPILYDLDGNNYTEIDTVKVYKETLDKFLVMHDEFIGSKLIYAPIRNADQNGIEHYINVCKEIKKIYPDFLAGFDLVGQEELGRPLKDFIPELLNLSKDVDFFFHAGETNWFGSTVDENLIDAVLLGAKRIGHGFALVKHPMVLEVVKQRNIAIEVSPISNQVLQLVFDYRNHPCAHFFADNYPVVISSDDPSFWKATPLTHDFYIAFLGIASAHSDLRLLKKLALNSLHYSAMSDEQKQIALQKWQIKWNQFIQTLVNDDSISNGGSSSVILRELFSNNID